jgi:hypothetical protein
MQAFYVLVDFPHASFILLRYFFKTFFLPLIEIARFLFFLKMTEFMVRKLVKKKKKKF